MSSLRLPLASVRFTPVFADSGDRDGRHFISVFGRSPELGAVEMQLSHRPSLLLPRSAALPAALPAARYRREESDLRSPQGLPLDQVSAASGSELRAATEALKAANIPFWEAELKSHERLFMELGLGEGVALRGKPELHDGRLLFKNPSVAAARVDSDLRVASLDIENGVTIDHLFSIAVHITGCGAERRKVFVLAADPAGLKGEDYEAHPDEASLLSAFLKWFAAEDPDVIIGWYVIGHDLRYLQERCDKNYLDFTLGRSGRKPVISEIPGVGHFCTLPGRVVLDGLPLFREAGYVFPDYKLETVARQLLQEGKEIDPSEDKVAEIERMFRDDKPALCRYNLQDCVLVTRLFRDCGMLDYVKARCRSTGLQPGSIGIGGAALDALVLPRLHRRGLAAPPAPEGKGAAAGRPCRSRAGLLEKVAEVECPALAAEILRSFAIEPPAVQDGPPLLAPLLESLVSAREMALAQEREAVRRAAERSLSQLAEAFLSPAQRHQSPAVQSLFANALRSFHAAAEGAARELGAGLEAFDEDRLFFRLGPDSPAAVEDFTAELRRRIGEQLSRDRGAATPSPFLRPVTVHPRLLLLPRKDDAQVRWAALAADGSLLWDGIEFTTDAWSPLALFFQRQLILAVLRGDSAERFTLEFLQQLRFGHHDSRLAYRRKLREADERAKVPPPHLIAARALGRSYGYITYVMTVNGPVPLEKQPQDPDYKHYIDEQISPIADALLAFDDLSVDALTGARQMKLF
ncbi:MAG: polymerase [Verrucomicrobiota bacterium]|jgi:DNA polymerase-2